MSINEEEPIRGDKPMKTQTREAIEPIDPIEKAKKQNEEHREEIRKYLRTYPCDLTFVINFEGRYVTKGKNENGDRVRRLVERPIWFRSDWDHHFDAALNRYAVHTNFSKLAPHQRVSWAGFQETRPTGSHHFHIVASLPPVNTISTASNPDAARRKLFTNLRRQVEKWYPGVKTYWQLTEDKERTILYSTKDLTLETNYSWFLWPQREAI